MCSLTLLYIRLRICLNSTSNHVTSIVHFRWSGQPCEHIFLYPDLYVPIVISLSIQQGLWECTHGGSYVQWIDAVFSCTVCQCSTEVLFWHSCQWNNKQDLYECFRCSILFLGPLDGSISIFTARTDGVICWVYRLGLVQIIQTEYCFFLWNELSIYCDTNK